MTVLVTGGSGLVGSHVIEALRARGEVVRALVRQAGRAAAVERLGAEVVIGDVTDAEAWRRAAAGGRGGRRGGVRGIVHAAAIVVRPEPLERYVAVNVGGTRLAAETACRIGARLVHLSSVAVYGHAAAYAAGSAQITEDFPFQEISPHDFYARSKRMGEEAVREAVGRGGLSAAAIRPNVIYGERDRIFTPRVVRIARLRIAPAIGPGTNRLSCVYAGNVAAAAVAALDAPIAGFRAYHATEDAPPALTQREFARAFAEALGIRAWSVRVPVAAAKLAASLGAGWQRLQRPGRYAGLGRAAIAFATGDNPYVCDRARAELGWRPPFATREAIARTARWFRENEKPGR